MKAGNIAYELPSHLDIGLIDCARMWPFSAAYFILSRLLMNLCQGKLWNYEIEECNTVTETETENYETVHSHIIYSLVEFEHLILGILWFVTFVWVSLHSWMQ